MPFVWCAAAVAEEEGEHHVPTILDVMPYWVNFLCYVLVLIWLLRKPVAKAWAARVTTIETAVHKGKSEREAAEAALAEAAKREAGLQTEIRSLIDQIKRESATESAQILYDAKIRADRIRAQGKDMMAAEAKAFETALKKELAEEVVKRATEKLMREMTPEKDTGLRTAALKDLRSLVQ